MNREEEVYAAALEIPVAERAAFLDGACGGDQALRHRVEALLEANDMADEFFNVSAVTRPAIAVQENPGT